MICLERSEHPIYRAFNRVMVLMESVKKVAKRDDSIEDILSKIRSAEKEKKAIRFVSGYAGALRAVRNKQ